MLRLAKRPLRRNSLLAAPPAWAYDHDSVNPLVTARRIIGAVVLLVAAYILWRGPERFSVESFGTLLFSPVICVRLLPEPLNHWLLRLIAFVPETNHLLCFVPVLMLSLALAFAIVSLRIDSLRFALASAALTGTVFSVYHFVQPLGITLVQY